MYKITEISIFTISEIEAQIRDLQAKRKPTGAPGGDGEQEGGRRVGLGEEGHFDRDIYQSRGGDNYVTSIAATDEQEVRRQYYHI